MVYFIKYKIYCNKLRANIYSKTAHLHCGELIRHLYLYTMCRYSETRKITLFVSKIVPDKLGFSVLQGRGSMKWTRAYGNGVPVHECLEPSTPSCSVSSL